MGSPNDMGSLWKQAQECAERARSCSPSLESPALTLSELQYLAGRQPYQGGDYASAAKSFERALESDPRNLRAAALLGQCYWWLEDYAAGLAVLERASALWDDPGRSKDEEYWLGAILAWTIGNAAKIPDEPAFARARERLASELERGAAFKVEELLSAAEFLAMASPELRDCELAELLVEKHGLRSAFAGTASDKAARAILDRIEAACR